MARNFFFAVRGGAAFKINAHEADPEQLVIKASHPELGAVLAQIAGVEILETTKGEHYHLTFVPRKAFLAQFGKIATVAAEGDIVLPAAGGAIYHLDDAISEANGGDGDGEEEQEEEQEEEEQEEDE